MCHANEHYAYNQRYFKCPECINTLHKTCIFYVMHMLWNCALLFYLLVQNLTLGCLFLKTRSDLFMDK